MINPAAASSSEPLYENGQLSNQSESHPEIYDGIAKMKSDVLDRANNQPMQMHPSPLENIANHLTHCLCELEQ